MTLLNLLKTQIERYHITHVRDIYKLLYLGTLGNAHFMNLEETLAKKYLKDELKFQVEDFREPLMEDISVDKQFVRVNLRPFKYYELPRQELFLVMKQSASIMVDKEKFIDKWHQFGDFIKDRTLRFDLDDYNEFDEEMEENHYPAVSHSESYVRLNKPAYRVVYREYFLDSFFDKWKIFSYKGDR